MLGFFRRRTRRSELSDNDESIDVAPTPRAPQRPPLPKPERINRNVLTIAAVVMGTLVLAAVVFMQPNRPSAADTRTHPAMPPSLPGGTFLDQPLALDTTRLSIANDTGDISQPPVPSPAADPYTSSTPPSIDPRVEAYRVALEAPLFANAGVGGRRDPSLAALPEALERESTIDSPNSQNPELSSKADSSGARSTAIKATVIPAPKPFAVQGGTLIPAVLLTGIDSDLPGEVLAQVARDVYDSRTMEALLIPKGSKLLGTYQDRVAVGQDRLLIAWTRVIFPDGRSITLPGLETKDRTGAGGLSDQVDRHTGRVFGTATLLSLISAGVQLAQPRGSIGAYGTYPSIGQVTAGDVGRELADVATQMLRRDINIRPTIRIRQGMPFNVYLNSDLSFLEPYVEER